MKTLTLPSHTEMLQAVQNKNAEYDGVFFTAVKTTGVFCRPNCPARRPLPQNIEFYAKARDALFAGYRPCKRCRPLEPRDQPPTWLKPLLDAIDEDPARRWTDQDIRALGVEPGRVRRWFQKHYDMTFHAYSRGRRLGLALGRIRHGSSVTAAAFDHGYDSLAGFHEAFTKLVGVAPSTARTQTQVVITRIATPLGPMIAGASDTAVCLLEFADRRMLETQLRRMTQRLQCRLTPGTNEVLDQLASELEEYFAGKRRTFASPLMAPGTEFQQTVWKALVEIPSGETESYGALARRIGRPTAVRAVARANGDNRIAILIPCHRVVGSDGKLTGYGGGLWRKQRLLEIEQAPLHH